MPPEKLDSVTREFQICTRPARAGVPQLDDRGGLASRTVAGMLASGPSAAPRSSVNVTSTRIRLPSSAATTP